MRCTTCAALHYRDLQNCSLRLHDSPEDLRASAENGCEFCALCWALCVQKRLYETDEYNKGLKDKSVWLEGYLYPSQNYNRIMENMDIMTSPNGLELCIGSFTLEDGNERNTRRITVGQLPIFADPGTPASHLYLETWTTIDRNPQEYVNFAKQSISRCKLQHKLCTTPSSDGMTASQMPTRLIEVGDSQGKPAVRLVITDESKVQIPYLALSYCWGENAESMMKLRRDNIEELQSYIDEERLSKTHRDAFQVTRDLGYRYIWIDALCIVQGDIGDKAAKADWEYESPRMRQVYSHAALTIVAGRAADSRDGFLENKIRQAAGPCAIPFCRPDLIKWRAVIPETDEMGDILVALPRSVDDGPVSKRAWCFQEAILSPRALVFGKEQLYFRCREISVWEDGHVKRSPFYELQNARSAVYSSTSPTLNSLGEGDEEVRRRMLIYWYREILWQFTERGITNPDDIFAALSGLAQAVKPQIRSSYLAGLWEVDMVRGLLWKPRHVHSRGPRWLTKCERRMSRPQENANTQTQMVPVAVPSWSWAAIEGQVGLDHTRRHEDKYHESNALIHPKYQGRWTRDSVCHSTAVHITSCELEFFGRPQRVRTSKHLRRQSRWPNVLERYKCEQYFGAWVDLIPMQENEMNQSIKGDIDLDGPGHIVATGFFDVWTEKVSTCWCVPVTKEEGLILTRDDTGKFRRGGTIKIVDLAWMTSVDEEEMCLI
ncbi:heterokaryon incompatibility protein-domain-containing protein [Xylaria sp. CBS 124048]|nr:heterokaryon incompatibility protein-domain-containing protein [Xylaria sp. CBS 124048]